MSIDYDILLLKPAREFYHLVRYHSWHNKGQKEYGKLMAEKK